MKKHLISITLTTFSALAVAAPFGLTMGMTPEELQAKGVTLKEEHKALGYFSTLKLPANLGKFGGYLLWMPPGIGLCKITAIQLNSNVNSFGEQLKIEFDDLETLLTEKYGKQRKFDIISPTSAWKESKDWMMALHKGDRHLKSFWSASTGAKMQDDVTAVELSTKAPEPLQGQINLVYELSNSSTCFDFEKKVKTGIL